MLSKKRGYNSMKRFNQFVENKIIPPMIKLSENKYIKVIEQSSQGMVSLLLIGSLFYLFASFPLNVWQNLVSPYKHILIEAGKVSTESISLYMLVAVSYYLSESYNKEGKDIDTLKMILLSIASFILFTNSSGSLEVSEIANVIDKRSLFFGAFGVFPAIFIAIVSVELYRFFDNKDLRISFSDKVPPMVSQSIFSIVPMLLVIVIWWIFDYFLSFSIVVLVNSLAILVLKFADSSIVMLLSTLMNRLFWTLGVHGAHAIQGVAGIFWEHMSQVNLELAMNQEPLEHIFTSVFIDNYIWIGLFPLSLALIISKSKRLKDLGKLSLIPSIFNISESLIFGLPIMLNPLMFFPFIFSTFITGLLAIFFVNLNMIPVPYLSVSWVFPAPLKAFLSTNGDLRAVTFVLFAWLITFLVYYPFVKAMAFQELDQD